MVTIAKQREDNNKVVRECTEREWAREISQLPGYHTGYFARMATLIMDLSSHLFGLHCTESSESLVFTGYSPKSQGSGRQWQLSDHNTKCILYPELLRRLRIERSSQLCCCTLDVCQSASQRIKLPKFLIGCWLYGLVLYYYTKHFIQEKYIFDIYVFFRRQLQRTKWKKK